MNKVTIGQIGQFVRRLTSFLRNDSNRKKLDRSEFEMFLRDPNRVQQCFMHFLDSMENAAKSKQLSCEKPIHSDNWSRNVQLEFYKVMCEAQEDLDGYQMHPMFWALFQLMREGEPVTLAYEEVLTLILKGPRLVFHEKEKLDVMRQHCLNQLRSEIARHKEWAASSDRSLEEYIAYIRSNSIWKSRV